MTFFGICFQANNFAEQMKNQLLQERELRAVTESCLMEDRTRSQHVCHASADNLKRCHAARELLTDAKQVPDKMSLLNWTLVRGKLCSVINPVSSKMV